MARLIVHTAKGPYIHRLPSGEVVAICMCGLSDKYPFCSGKHKLVQDEDANKVYTY
ncbi:MAG: CDGSH iron-sulfur domain-containing protein, partial [Caldivirga sp.]